VPDFTEIPRFPPGPRRSLAVDFALAVGEGANEARLRGVLRYFTHYSSVLTALTPLPQPYCQLWNSDHRATRFDHREVLSSVLGTSHGYDHFQR
jgi:hypothetical protein